MLGVNGPRVIEKALSSFESVKEQLLKGIRAIEERQQDNSVEVTRLLQENRELEDSSAKASRAVRGIEKLLGGE